MSRKKKREIDQKRRGEQERLKAKQEQEREHQLAKEQALLDDLESEPPIEEPEEIEKEYGEMSMPYTGPTSWDELDGQRQAEETASQVRRETYDVEYLVGNILRDHELVPTEKADRMMNVAEGYAERVNKILDGETLEKATEVLEIEALLASYERNLHPLQKSADWLEDQGLKVEQFLEKKELNGGARKRLSDSDFALPEKRKYPIHDKAHVRNALARAAQQIEKGGQGAEDARSALPKIRAAAKKFGITVSKSAFTLQKDANGDWRWVGVASNNFIDRQNDIMSKAAHQRYVEFLNNNKGLEPRFMHWHLPGLVRKEKADFWMEHEGSLILSGKLTEAEARFLLKMQAQTDLGMSVGGVALRRDDEDPRVIEDYILFEVSDLPLQKAANPFTSLTTITKEVGMDKLQYLTQLMGSEEEASAFLKKIEASNTDLASAGLTSKEVKTEEPAKAGEDSAGQPPVDVEELTKQIVAAVGKQYQLKEIGEYVAKAHESLERVPLLEEMVKELRRTRDDEVADQLTAPVSRTAWMRENRPSASDDTELKKESDEDKKLEKAGPSDVGSEYWLSKLTKTVPVEEAANA